LGLKKLRELFSNASHFELVWVNALH